MCVEFWFKIVLKLAPKKLTLSSTSSGIQLAEEIPLESQSRH